MTTTKERPILFNGAMVRAILAGTKTQTRRVVRPQPLAADPSWWGYPGPVPCEAKSGDAGKVDLIWGGPRCPYGQPGDRLWVREAWRTVPRGRIDGGYECAYRADTDGTTTGWTPSIHMPRWASRITLEVVGVRVERLQEISAEAIEAEGAVAKHERRHGMTIPAAISAFDGKPYLSLATLWMAGWDTLNAKRGFGWDTNPWVWVVEFRKVGA